MLVYHTLQGKSSVSPKVLVECTICFGDLKEASSSSSFQLASFAPHGSNTKKLRRACIEGF